MARPLVAGLAATGGRAAAGGAGAALPLLLPSAEAAAAAFSAFFFARTAANPPGAPMPGITETGAAVASAWIDVGRSWAVALGLAAGLGCKAGLDATDGRLPVGVEEPEVAPEGADGGGRLAGGAGAAFGFGGACGMSSR